MLRSLVSRGLIVRQLDPMDQRRSLIAISTKGRRLFERLAPQNELAYAEIERSLGVDKVEQLYSLLGESIDSLSADHAEQIQ
jgi:DNA-binding MarR family transcriptional regulator